jgi:phage head maturation protease
VHKTYSKLSIKSIDEDQRVVTGIASTPTPDLVGDVVEPMGAVNIDELPLPFMLDHDHGQNIGVVEWAKATPAGIEFRARIAKIAEPGAARDLVDKGWSLIKAGLRRGVSIGFAPIEIESLPTGGYWFKTWRWLELSAVSVPAQPEARVTGVKAAQSKDRVVKLQPAEKLRGRMLLEAESRSARRKRLGIPSRPVKLSADDHVQAVLDDARTRRKHLRPDAARQVKL